MKVIYGTKGVGNYSKPVIALGIFDGVHRGHRLILEDAVRSARRHKGTSMVLTFWPHPRKQPQIYSLQHRLKLIAQIGIDVCVVIKFDKEFSRISAQDFVRKILAGRLGAYYVYVGENFKFGRGAGGNFITLKKLSAVYGFKLKVFEVARTNNRPVSSTYIRALIAKGRLKEAQRLLAYPVSILGTVVRGDSLGRELGFPTANIDPHHEVLPASGIYAVSIILRRQRLNGVCYIGRRPTFRKKMARKAKRIEVYIFGFRKNIYGEFLEIRFIKKIREGRKFLSARALTIQIKKDIVTAKQAIPTH